jgi:tetratricopeptide (TPR) repeat protein
VLYATYALALGGYLLLYRAVTSSASPAITFDDNPAAHASALVRVMTAIAVVGKGLALQLVPVGQSADWSYDAIPLVSSPADPRLLAACAALVAWLGLGLALRPRAPIVLGGLGWYLGTLLPASNLLFPIGTLFGERLLYLPSAGLALVAGAGLAALAARIPRPALIAGSVGAVLALGAATISYAHAWGDELRLFKLAAERVPRSSRVHHKLSTLLLLRGEKSAALAEADRAVALSPRNARALVVQASILHDFGRVEEEVRALRAALASSPDDADGLYGLGRIARDEGRLEEAAALWRRAIASNPHHAASLSDLAGYELLRGQPELALGHALQAVEADETLASGWYNLGLLHQDRGDVPRSRAAFARFVETAGAEYATEAEMVRRTLEKSAAR